MRFTIIACLLCILVFFSACDPSNNKQEVIIIDTLLLNKCVKDLTGIMVHDIFSPPVASRIYAYTTLAWFEVIRHSESVKLPSLAAQLKGFPVMPVPETGKTYQFEASAIEAFFYVANLLTFSKDSIESLKEYYLSPFRNGLDENTLSQSLAFGDSVAEAILKRTLIDNYKQTRTMPRYNAIKQSGKWQQTPPDYMDALEPYWSNITPFLMDSASQFNPPPPPAYSPSTKSAFYTDMMEVYNTTNNLSAEMDTIAHFWDDNAFVIEHSGHMMFATKKTTPGGHWLGIVSELCSKNNLSKTKTAQAIALAASIMYDAFISCWDEKYKSRYIRPVTAIQELVDDIWMPLLQTPSFPEYTSGHSVVSSAVATVMTDYFGEDQSFTDSTEYEFQHLVRSFPSIKAAAAEACISRLYGGIHFRPSIEQGAIQGKNIGELYIKNIKY